MSTVAEEDGAPSLIHPIEVGDECLVFLLRRMFGAEAACLLTDIDCDKRQCHHIHALSTFLRRKFEVEEKAMAATGYPFFDAHRRGHAELVTRLMPLGRSCPRLGQHEMSRLVLAAVNGHIATFDQPFELWLRRR